MQMCRLSRVSVACINATQIAIRASTLSFDTNPIVEIRRLRRAYADVYTRQSHRSSNKCLPNCLELMVLIVMSRDECLDEPVKMCRLLLLLLPYIGPGSSKNVIGPAGHEHGG